MDREFSEYLDKLADNEHNASEQEIKKVMDKIKEKETLPRKHAKRSWYKPAGLIAACAMLVIGAVTLLPDLLHENNNDGIVYAAEDYAEIYDIIKDFQQEQYRHDDLFVDSGNGLFIEDMVVDTDQAAPESAVGGDTAQNSSNAEPQDDVYLYADEEKDYSETNNQVKGVDEADIVKTDGDYIYQLRKDDNTLFISSALGAESKLLSATSLFPTWEETESSGYYENAIAMYIFGDKLALVSLYEQWEEIYYYRNTCKTKVYIYDISNPAAPVLTETIAQDGNYSDSRMVDGKIYLISEYYIYNEIEKNDPETYIPSVYLDETAELIAPGDICIMGSIESESYLVVSSIDINDALMLDTQSLLGSSDIIYMTAQNLYIADAVYHIDNGEEYAKEQYLVTDQFEYCVTDIVRFALADGTISMEATGQIPGFANDQFSFDEYNGYLRIVVTDDRSSYSIYRDPIYGWENYEWNDDSRSNALYILDAQLQQVGAIEGLAPDERIYSTRFSGDIGYFVTFRQVDPLFAVDLSDPTAPKVLSELKIPGFSEYLHVYAEGRLFGLGKDADEETGISNTMKLSMFDTSDPANVTEKHTLILDTDHSEALYNHKAILIAPQHDLIAFPTDGGYDVYGYNDESGFYQKGHFESGEWYYDTRGLYVEDSIYICGFDTMTIVDMNTLEHLLTVDLVK